LRVIIRQNPRRSHIETEILQTGVLFYLLRELISERRGVGLAIDRKLAGRLIVSRDPHIRRGQTFIKAQQDLDRIEARVDRRRERFPVGFGLANELRLRRVARNQAIESRNGKTRVGQVKQKEQENRRVGAAG
jgi:hypothetical protein